MFKYFINKYFLQSQLLKSIKTWSNYKYESTINLMLLLNNLTEKINKCNIYKTNYESNHDVIKTIIKLELPKLKVIKKFNFKIYEL